MPSDPLSILARADSADEALVDGEGVLAYRDVAALVRARLDVFRDAGLVEGARVALVGAPTRDRVIDVLAAIEFGAPLVMLHPRSPAREREDLVRRTHPRLVIDELGHVETREVPVAPREGRGVLAVLHTSGTTGEPKAALLSRGAFVASARASHARLPLAAGDRWLLVMPIAHVGGLSIVTRSLIAGSSIALAAPFAPNRACKAVSTLRPRYVSLVPAMLDGMIEAGFEASPSLAAILLGGAACPERTLARALARDLPIRTTYGLTEACSQVTTSSADVQDSGAGSGEPLPGIEVRLGADETIQIRGRTLFDGYLGLPSPFDEHGWFDTGDVGRFDAHGRLHVLARRRDLIVTGGENVYPAEVEAALERLRGVRAACVFGTPDERFGQRVAAALVLDEPSADPRALVAQLRDELASFKLPRAVAVVDRLVVNASRKLDRAATARLAERDLRPIA
jgi:o-succinylbenzoate---CoA ligase